MKCVEIHLDDFATFDDVVGRLPRLFDQVSQVPRATPLGAGLSRPLDLEARHARQAGLNLGTRLSCFRGSLQRSTISRRFCPKLRRDGCPRPPVHSLPCARQRLSWRQPLSHRDAPRPATCVGGLTDPVWFDAVLRRRRACPLAGKRRSEARCRPILGRPTAPPASAHSLELLFRRQRPLNLTNPRPSHG